MKKITATIFALALVFCLLPASAFAVGALPQPDYGYGLPQPDYIGGGSYDSGWSSGDNYVTDDYPVSSSVAVPVIMSEPADVTGAIGNIPVALQVEAYASDGGSVHYQWYAANLSGDGTLTAIPGAYSSVYTPPQTPGTAYYCVGVYNVVGNARSVEVESRMIAVNYSGIEILNTPSKTSYTQGESVSLRGLVVRVYDSNGSYWDSADGSGLSVYPSKLSTAGQTAVELSYGMSSAVFYVNVSAAASNGTASGGAQADSAAQKDENHVHEYGDWVITKEATCISTGIRTRSCECGDTQTEVIPKTDHSWDEGVITKQPTATSNGSRLYTCTICKANKSEIIPAGTDTTAVSTSQGGLTVDQPATNATAPVTAPPTPTSGVIGTNDVGAGSADGVNNTGSVNKTTDSTGWWLIPVSALLLVGCGSGAYYLMKKKGGE